MQSTPRQKQSAIVIHSLPHKATVGIRHYAAVENNYTVAIAIDILFQNTSTGQVFIWEMGGNTRMGGGALSINPGPTWQAIGTDGSGSDILFQNTSTGQTSIWEMDEPPGQAGGRSAPTPGRPGARSG
jgi:hypothetical protein